jgi:hypothetical protein
LPHVFHDRPFHILAYAQATMRRRPSTPVSVSGKVVSLSIWECLQWNGSARSESSEYKLLALLRCQVLLCTATCVNSPRLHTRQIPR